MITPPRFTRDRQPLARMPRVPASASAGFTLIEMVVVISVLAVFATLAVPSFTTSRRELALAGQAREIVAVLRFARSEAVTQHRSCRLVLDNRARAYWLESLESDTYGVQHYEPLRNIELPGDSDLAGGAHDVDREAFEDLPRELQDLAGRWSAPFELDVSPLPPDRHADAETLAYLAEVDDERQRQSARLGEQSGRQMLTFEPDGTTPGYGLRLRDPRHDVEFGLRVDPVTGAVELERHVLRSLR